MKKYKVIVYAICKNEEKFVSRWYESMKEADEIYVLDTGSNDNTVKFLQELGVNVTTKIINPWRFDIARNESLALVPNDADICVCTDLDEVFIPGWRDILENSWNENNNSAKYHYIWSLDENDKPIVEFYYSKIHDRHNYRWIHPVHEVLTSDLTNENIVVIDNLTLKHYPDNQKSRESYLPLLELSITENPENDRNYHYLGREYMYYNRYQESIDTLIEHLNLKSATWKDERCASMRFIARNYKCLKRYEEAKMWINKAILEAPHLRCPYMEAALIYYELEDYKNVIKMVKKALKITNHEKTYINEVFSWNETPYDLLSISYYYLGDIDNALKYVKKARKINNHDERLINNENIIKNIKKNQEINH